jgi:7-carboxy-7-deazaguanine synthase
LETSGEAAIERVDPRVHKIMDLKAPGSGECHRNRWSNLDYLTQNDEIKFVLAGRADYEWMRDTIRSRGLASKVKSLLASCVFGSLSPKELVGWVLEDGLDVRVQLQMHKYIWGATAEGV